MQWDTKKNVYLEAENMVELREPMRRRATKTGMMNEKLPRVRSPNV